MSALAAYLRERAAADVKQLGALERIELALALGDEDVRLYCVANGTSPEIARRRLMARRQSGRRLSVAAALDEA